MSWLKDRQDQVGFIIESDCRLLVQAILNQENGRAAVNLVIEDWRDLICQFQNVFIHFVPCLANYAAYDFTRAPSSMSSMAMCNDCPHVFLRKSLLLDFFVLMKLFYFF